MLGGISNNKTNLKFPEATQEAIQDLPKQTKSGTSKIIKRKKSFETNAN